MFLTSLYNNSLALAPYSPSSSPSLTFSVHSSEGNSSLLNVCNLKCRSTGVSLSLLSNTLLVEILDKLFKFLNVLFCHRITAERKAEFIWGHS